jgi:hypothetical protein
MNPTILPMISPILDDPDEELGVEVVGGLVGLSIHSISRSQYRVHE